MISPSHPSYKSDLVIFFSITFQTLEKEGKGERIQDIEHLSNSWYHSSRKVPTPLLIHKAGHMCWHRATIVSRRKLSPTVTGLKLRLQPSDNNIFTFTPGQWVDFKPLSNWTDKIGGKNVGGYSITSIPQSLPQIDLAVKESTHPVAAWVTFNAKPNDIVRVGGTFTYETEEYNPSSRIHNNNKLLFIAGGVGINPLFSMIQQWHVDETTRGDEMNRKSRAVLLYSGGRVKDLLFLDQLEKLVKDSPDQLCVICTTTQQSNCNEHKSKLIKREGRIDLELIKEAVAWLNRYDEADHERVEVFLCGPPGMPESIMEQLVEEKIVQSRNNIHFEKWW